MQPEPVSPVMSVVVLTRGDRPEALDEALRSVAAQSLPGVEVVLVLNGAEPGPRPDDVVLVDLPENVGIPEGRNIGLRAARGELVAFLDDDGALVGPDVLRRSADHFRRDERLAVVAWRIVDEQGATARRHVPRPGRGSATRSGPVAGFLGGACVVRRDAFERVGGYAGEFFYAMEETDLAWRLVDAGGSLWYDADATMFHPASTPARHPGAIERTARNRAWAAHRNLPWPLLVAHLLCWTAIGLLRNGWSGAQVHVRATRAALRDPLGPRRPMSWRTVWRLTRLGRPPVL